MKGGHVFIFLVTAFVTMTMGSVFAGESAPCFYSSLHHTGEGMRYWYEADDGFMAITGVPYKELGCKNCHVKSCNDCHLEETKEGPVYSTEKARSSQTCLECHSREKATIKYDEMMDCQGAHACAYMGCNDCHTSKEVHGDGTFYHSMRQEGAMEAACTDCHTKESVSYPSLPDSRSHTVHNDKLACNACHVQNTISCYNCHFGVLAETKSKPDSFATKVKDFLLLVKFRGKVTSGTMQTLVGKNNEPFITYVPYFTHSITGRGRKCGQCHDTEAVNRLASSEKFTPAIFRNGELEFYKGVIPLVPELLDWPFLEKKEGKWVPFEPDTDPLIQLGVYAEPFRNDALKKMARKQTYKE
ncbi:MAG: hypothetical protein R6V41_01725 [Desulfobacteraceae bacterium]